MINAFFVMLEFFVAYYSRVPGHMHTLQYLFFGLEHGGHTYNNLVPMMWGFVVLTLTGFTLLAIPLYPSQRLLAGHGGSGALFLGLWLDKGIGFVLGGFVPTPAGRESSSTLRP